MSDVIGNIPRSLFIAILAAIASVAAKPMESPTLEQAVGSENIVIADYLDYRRVNNEPVTDLGCVLSRYKVRTTIKGSGLDGATINVIYCFSDGSGCIPSKDWKFSNARMPRKGSRWLLFLNKDSQSDVYRNYFHVDAYSTYRGNFGRMDATDENEKRIRSLLRK